MAPNPDNPHALYRFWNAASELLYIGLTYDIAVRFQQHEDQKPWWTEIARITVEQHPSRREVKVAEKWAILTEHPKYNVQGTLPDEDRYPNWSKLTVYALHMRDGYELYLAGSAYDELRCIALAGARRCKRLVEHGGQCGSWRPLVSKAGLVDVYVIDGHSRSENTPRRWLTQRCLQHDDPDTIDAVAPEWIPFDPQTCPPGLVKPITDEWRPAY